MNLLGRSNYGQPQCFVCRFAERPVVIWPQHPTLKPAPALIEGNQVWTMGTWAVFHKVEGGEPVYTEGPNGTSGPMLRSKHANIQCCSDHWNELEQDWVNIAADEVALAGAWDNYIDGRE